jgi:hypothetical protein
MRARALFGVVLGGIVLSKAYGQGFHLYDPAQDKLAHEILATHSNSPVTKIVDLEKARFDDYAKRQAQLRQLEGQANRDLILHRLLTVTNAGTNTIQADVTARLNDLTGGGRPRHTTEQLNDALYALANSASQFKLFTGQALPQFSPATNDIPPENIDPSLVKGLDDATRADATSFYGDFRTNWLTLKTCVDDFADGEIGGNRGRWLDLLAKAKADQASLKQQQSDLARKQKELNTAVQNASTNAIANAFTAFTNFVGSVSDLGVLGATNLVARYEYVSNGIAVLNQALEAFQTGSKPKTPASTNAVVLKALAFASSTSNLWTSAANLEAAIHQPPLAQLRVQLAILQAELNEIQQRLAMEQNRITFGQNAFTAAVEEASLLDTCGQRLKASFVGPGGSSSVLSQIETTSVRDIFDKGDPAVKERLYNAINSYLDAERISRVKERLAVDQLNMSYFEESRVIGSSGLALWDGLIAEPINQLAIYYGGGFKQEDIAKMVVEALGLGAIAWRTGR